MRATSKATYNICVIAMAVALMTLCSWITIPFHIGFTLQTFAVFLISGGFPFSVSFTAMLLYVALGFVGVPVFSGFNAGLSAILGPTGGFILSFPICAFVISGARRSKTATSMRYILVSIVALIISYTIGTLWYTYVFAGGTQTSIIAALSVCVLPFIIPDVLKLLLSALILNRLDPYLKRLPI